MPVMPFEGVETTTLRDEIEATIGTLAVVEAEQAVCEAGCPTLEDCCHAPDDAEDAESMEDDRDFGDWLEATYDPDGWKVEQNRYERWLFGD